MAAKILFFGPYSPPITGQSIAFKEVVDSFPVEERVLVDTTKFYRFRILNTCSIFLCLLYAFAFNSIDTVYFTCSRSIRGFVKDFLLLILCKLGAYKVVNHLHGADFVQFYNQAEGLKKIIHWSYQSIDTHIVLLEEMKEQFAMFPGVKLEVVSNFYPKELDELVIDKAKPIVLSFFSNLMRTKGIFYFLDALEVLLEKYNAVEVKIAGEVMTDEEASLRHTKKEFDARLKQLQDKFLNRISVFGVIGGKDKEQFLLNTSIFVLPTFYKSEAVPLSILEAMRVGSAIVTTKHNYIPNFVTEDSGVLVEKKSVKSLIEGIEILLNDEEKLGTAQKYNIQYAKNNFSSQKYIASIKKIINFTK